MHCCKCTHDRQYELHYCKPVAGSTWTWEQSLMFAYCASSEIFLACRTHSGRLLTSMPCCSRTFPLICVKATMLPIGTNKQKPHKKQLSPTCEHTWNVSVILELHNVQDTYMSASLGTLWQCVQLRLLSVKHKCVMAVSCDCILASQCDSYR